MTTGIYEIVNASSGSRYVGQSVDIENRIRDHLKALERGTHRNSLLQKAVVKYDILAFYWCVLEVVDRAELTAKEQHHIDLTPSGKSYQLAPVAGSSLGIVRSEEYKKRISDTLKGHPVSASTRAKMSKAKKGMRWDRDVVERRNASNRGRKRSADTRAKLSIKSKGNKNCLGRKLSANTRLKISMALAGRPKSEAHRIKLSVGNIRYSENRRQQNL